MTPRIPGYTGDADLPPMVSEQQRASARHAVEVERDAAEHAAEVRARQLVKLAALPAPQVPAPGRSPTPTGARALRRAESVEDRLGRLEESVDKRLGRIESKVDALQTAEQARPRGVSPRQIKAIGAVIVALVGAVTAIPTYMVGRATKDVDQRAEVVAERSILDDRERRKGELAEAVQLGVQQYVQERQRQELAARVTAERR